MPAVRGLVAVPIRSLAALLSAFALLGCAVPVAGALNESDANDVVVALEHGGIAATKEVDPAKEGSYRVSVARDDQSAAVGILSEQSLPPQSPPGVLDALGQGSMVPSRGAEHAKLIAGTAGDIERTLRGVDGVLSARVHLAVLPTDALDLGAPHPPPTASVLLRHRGATPPLAEKDVQRLVAGAVPGLQPEQVAVVNTPSPVAPAGHERDLARLGPIAVTRSSVGPLRLIFGGGALMNIVAIGVGLGLWSRLRKAQDAEAERLAASESTAQGTR